MVIIAAMTRDRLIGREGKLPWNIPEEYAHFLSLIRGATVIMGRRSYEAFGNDCTCKHMVVVSRSRLELSGVLVCGSVEEAVTVARGLPEQVFIAGGAMIYEQTLPLAQEMYLSYIRGSYEGDSYFPAFEERDWEILRHETHERFDFVAYARRRDP